MIKLTEGVTIMAATTMLPPAPDTLQDRAARNRAHVRALLRLRQPAFAAALETTADLAARDLAGAR
jgi:hypothetical protein